MSKKSEFVAGEPAIADAILKGIKVSETFGENGNPAQLGTVVNDDEFEDAEIKNEAPITEIKLEKKINVEENELSEEKKFIFDKLNELNSNPENKDKSEDELLNLISGEKKAESSFKNSDFDVNSFVKEKTSGKFESFESILEKLNSIKEEKVYSDRIQKLIELDEKGIDLKEILKYESLGVDKLDPTSPKDALELIRNNMRLSDPDMSEDEISLTLKKNYYIDEYDEDSEDSQLKSFALIREAKKAKLSLLDKQKQMELPVSNSNKSAIDQEAQLRDYQKKWEQDVEDMVKEYKTESFELGKDNKFDFDVTPSKDGLKKTMNNFFSLHNRYIKPDGTRDIAGMRRDMLILDNFPKILKAAVAQTESKSLKKMVQEWKNPSSKIASSTTGKVIKSMDEQIAEQMARQSVR